MSFIVEINNITKKYGNVTAVCNVSFAIKEGEFFSLLGPSGCGKTTILRIIGGFIEQNSGTVLIDGANMQGIAPNNRKTSMVFQNLALFPHMNVMENIVYGLKKRRTGKSIIEEKLKNILNAVNLTGYEKRSINELSGGQQQRVALARSLIIEPDILLLDEPLASLDKKLRVSMRTELKEIQRRTKTTFLYVTHDQSEAITMSDNIAVMNNGKIIQIGRPDVIYNRPANIFVADFIGAGNFISLKRIDAGSRPRVLITERGGRILLENNNSADKAFDDKLKTGTAYNGTGAAETDSNAICAGSGEDKTGNGKNTLQHKNIENPSLQEKEVLSVTGNDSFESSVKKKLPVFFIRPEKIKISSYQKPTISESAHRIVAGGNAAGINRADRNLENRDAAGGNAAGINRADRNLENTYFGTITSVIFEGPDIRIRIFSEEIGHITAEIKNLEQDMSFSESDHIEFCWEISEGLILND